MIHVHHWKLTWNLQITQLKRKILHFWVQNVNFSRCTAFPTYQGAKFGPNGLPGYMPNFCRSLIWPSSNRLLPTGKFDGDSTKAVRSYPIEITKICWSKPGSSSLIPYDKRTPSSLALPKFWGKQNPKNLYKWLLPNHRNTVDSMKGNFLPVGMEGFPRTWSSG